MRSEEEIWSLYLEGEGDQLELDELSVISQGCRNLVKFPAWAALVRAQRAQADAMRSAVFESVAHDQREPIRRILMDEESRGRIAALESFMNLPAAWEEDVRRLQEMKEVRDD